ncbi:hypothetical protein BBK36DRAFT_1160193 [Trichoderma citrinoviride]|uniref:NYN domain-containing protein n=1 Tax=Trichoderma citrinoviride TaxID=58853 RepID=A0A2T4B9W9_9HYPO|nr:hypothetical protein BBK36DRAFT_1160193 [Trichoderma citrinoviride]PTB66078.1 hypothetical protein BBK36DRAFT_1160193 [Trichoderma citrinoviride]
MIYNPDAHHIEGIETAAAASHAPVNPAKLGDFSRLYAELLDSPTLAFSSSEASDYYDDDSSPALKATSLSSAASDRIPDQSLDDATLTRYPNDASTKRSRASAVTHGSPREIKHAIPVKAGGHSGIASSPPSHRRCTCIRGLRTVQQPLSLATPPPECPECSPSATTTHRSRAVTNKPREKLRLKEDKHGALMMGLIPYRVRDAAIAEKHPEITSQGVHVFVDMSNIDIGFQSTLKEARHLDDRARLSPLPHLNLQFLTKILVRDRQVVALNVGCSTVPGRSEPRYVQQLRDLGYQIDLRERKRVVEVGLPSAGAPDTLRYVEDLVDETLQVRIAESVMEYFRTPGTIVLATGDAKPSPHSDGFFSCVQRALKMGWNVEVVSWRGNLSLRWIDKQWMSQWRDRFRVIELDDFLEVLK